LASFAQKVNRFYIGDDPNSVAGSILQYSRFTKSQIVRAKKMSTPKNRRLQDRIVIWIGYYGRN